MCIGHYIFHKVIYSTGIYHMAKQARDERLHFTLLQDTVKIRNSALHRYAPLKKLTKPDLNFNTIDDPLQNIIQRFKNHPSIISIKEKVVSGSFDFKPLTVEEVSTEIFKMNQKKSTTGVSIGFLKDNLDICAPTLTKILNSCISDGIFPNELKLGDITLIFKSVEQHC